MPFQMIIVRVCLCAAVLLLTGCAATIQRETNAGARKIESATYTGVDIVLTDAARRLQADNPQFSVRELGDYVRRRLEATELLNPQGTHRVEVTIESFRVRSAAAAVMLGIMAGTDQIDGYVRVYDARGRQVHGYKVNAHYGLGGWGGDQDGMRMNWLYDKFSELTIAELSGSTPQNAVAKGRAVPAAPSGTAAVSVSATQAGQPVSIEPHRPRPCAGSRWAPRRRRPRPSPLLLCHPRRLPHPPARGLCLRRPPGWTPASRPSTTSTRFPTCPTAGARPMRSG